MAKEYTTQYPTGLDTDTQMPTLADGDLGVPSQMNAVKDALQAVQAEIGSDILESGSLRQKVGTSSFLPVNSISDRLGDVSGQKLKLLERAADPSNLTNTGFLYSKEISGRTELFYIDDASAVTQITNAGGTISNTLDQAYDEGGAGAGRTITADSGPVVINASSTEALLLDGYVSADSAQLAGTLRLAETTDPTPSANLGFLYTKDDGGDTELYYQDDSGNVVQITADGYVSGGGGGGGGGGFDREEEFSASPDGSGRETFTISGSAAVNANTPSGRSVRVYVNGLKHKYGATPIAREFDIISATQIRVGGLNLSDDVEIVYGV